MYFRFFFLSLLGEPGGGGSEAVQSANWKVSHKILEFFFENVFFWGPHRGDRHQKGGFPVVQNSHEHFREIPSTKLRGSNLSGSTLEGDWVFFMPEGTWPTGESGGGVVQPASSRFPRTRTIFHLILGSVRKTMGEMKEAHGGIEVAFLPMQILHGKSCKGKLNPLPAFLSPRCTGVFKQRIASFAKFQYFLRIFFGSFLPLNVKLFSWVLSDCFCNIPYKQRRGMSGADISTLDVFDNSIEPQYIFLYLCLP